jgi:hypothetical protein
MIHKLYKNVEIRIYVVFKLIWQLEISLEEPNNIHKLKTIGLITTKKNKYLLISLVYISDQETTLLV